MKTHIIYHNDLDGYVSANILLTKYPNANCIEMSYEKETSLDRSLFEFGDYVYMVDFSLKPQDMKWLNMHTNLVWIDHHVSAINKSKENDYEYIYGIRQIGYSGAQLTWLYLYPETQNLFVKLVGQFDTFRTSNDREYFHGKVLPFFYGAQINIEKLNPANYNLEGYIFKTFKDFITLSQKVTKAFQEVGKIIYEYNKQEFEKAVKTNAYVRQIEGYRTLCINTTGKGSMIFEIPNAFDSEEHDMMCCYSYNGGKWNYGFYAPNGQTKVDCSKIALKYGGGGHICATGCTTNELLKELL